MNITTLSTQQPTILQSMVPIIQAKIGEVEVQAVNARDLHRYLDVKRKFATWVKERIPLYGFVEGEDYTVYRDAKRIVIEDGVVTLKPSWLIPQGQQSESLLTEMGDTAVEYYMTLDATKHICLFHKSRKGREFRNWLLAQEELERPNLEDASKFLEQLEDFVLGLDTHPESARDYFSKFLAEHKTIRLPRLMSALRAHAYGSVSSLATEMELQKEFLENLDYYFPGAARSPNVVGDKKPDGTLKYAGRTHLVECKLYDFNRAALTQLEHYLRYYKVDFGVAVARTLSVQLPDNIRFIKVDHDTLMRKAA